MVFVILLILSGCGKPSAEEYLAKAQDAQKRVAQMFEQRRSDQAVSDSMKLAVKEAIDNYGHVVAEYPRHESAPAAQFAIGQALQNGLQDFTGAIDAYRKYVRLYPEGKDAPLASFLIGYLYNNEFHNLDSAAAAYKYFLARYPDHDMAASARFELENLGKSPEELLPRPEVTTTENAKPARKSGKTSTKN
jgi:outer membrane protein assembly factor BamD (BamD/ComL family)